jgi:hypothetical protein
MTAAFSAGPARKYWAEVSMEPPEYGLDLGRVGPALAEARGAGMPAAVRAQPGDSGVRSGREHDLGDARVGERAALPGPDRPGVAAAHVEPRGDQFACGAGQRDGADLVALAVQADLAGAGGDREVIGGQAGAFLDPGAGVEQHPDDRCVARAAARRSAASCGRVSASGSPGRGTRTRLTAMRTPACSYIRVTAASAWLTVDAPARAASMSRFHAVTAPSAPTRSSNASRWASALAASQPV